MKAKTSERITSIITTPPSGEVVLVSGEPWDLTAAGALGVSLVWSAASEPSWLPSVPTVHFPNAATSFGERRLHTFSSLLSRPQAPLRRRKFAAYMYARCDRPAREHFFDLLSSRAAMVGETVDALGACKSGGRDERRRNRYKDGWHDEAVEVYEDYAFVVAFENTKAEGYVTEKIVNAFLAGAVPIYWGWEGVNGEVFEEGSFIDCSKEDKSLEECADEVVELWVGGGWERMAEGKVIGEEGLERWFGWEEGVRSRVGREVLEAFRMAVT